LPKQQTARPVLRPSKSAKTKDLATIKVALCFWRTVYRPNNIIAAGWSVAEKVHVNAFHEAVARGLRSHWRIQNFNLGGHMASAEREPITGVWGGAPSGVQGQSPWSGGQGS